MTAYDEMKSVFGTVPEFMQRIPRECIDAEWVLYQEAREGSSVLPALDRALIGLGVAEAQECRLCALYHAEMAQMLGATCTQIDATVQFASAASGRRPRTPDSDEFRREIAPVVAHVARQQITRLRSPSQDSAANERVGREAYAAFNARRLDELAALAAPDAPMMNATTGQVFHGPRGYRALVDRWVDAFPDLQWTLERLTASPTAVVIESTWTGTHRGTLLLPPRSLAPTGAHLSLPFCEVMQAEEGRIARRVLYFDLRALLAQLGAN